MIKWERPITTSKENKFVTVFFMGWGKFLVVVFECKWSCVEWFKKDVLTAWFINYFYRKKGSWFFFLCVVLFTNTPSDCFVASRLDRNRVIMWVVRIALPLVWRMVAVEHTVDHKHENYHCWQIWIVQLFSIVPFESSQNYFTQFSGHKSTWIASFEINTVIYDWNFILYVHRCHTKTSDGHLNSLAEVFQNVIQRSAETMNKLWQE